MERVCIIVTNKIAFYIARTGNPLPMGKIIALLTRQPAGVCCVVVSRTVLVYFLRT